MKKQSRTLRLNDRTIELIDNQQGDNFTERFENLVTRCAWELPEKEKQLNFYKQQIKREQRQLEKLSREVSEYRSIVQNLDRQLGTLVKLIEVSIKDRSA